MAITRANIVRQLYQFGGGADLGAGATGMGSGRGSAPGPGDTGGEGGYGRDTNQFGGGDGVERDTGLERIRQARIQAAAAEQAAEEERRRQEEKRREEERKKQIALEATNLFNQRKKEKQKDTQKLEVLKGLYEDDEEDVKEKPGFFDELGSNLRKKTLTNSISEILGAKPKSYIPSVAVNLLSPTPKGITTDSLGDMFAADFDMGLYGISGKDLTRAKEQFDVLGQDRVSQSEFEKVYGRKRVPETGGDGQPAAPMIPLTTSPISSATDQEPELSELQRLIAERGTPYRFMADGGIMNDDVIGGMADGNFDEMGRQMYGLGKLVKKATRAVKKIVKSPVGVAALGAYGFGLGPFSGIKGSGFLSNLFKGTGGTSFIDKLGGKATLGILGASALAGLTTPDEDEDQLTEEELRGPGLNIAAIRANPYATKGQAYRFYADGGDVEKEPVAKKVMPLLDMDGKEKDYRETGGFVDIGRMERADDVPARLSKNEFVFTADAVRNAGDGDIDKGAEVMYNMMKNLENGGDVSEESQGLEGARNMFQTSQRLEEVL